MHDFLVFFEQDIKEIMANIASYADSLKAYKCHDDFYACLLKDLESIWVNRVAKSFILELSQSKESGMLEGKKPEERYQFFCSAFTDVDNKNLFLNRYPVLKKQFLQFKDYYLTFIKNLLDRLDKDFLDLEIALKLSLEGSELTKIEFLGDPHGYFNRVATMSFSNRRTIVYKPRTIRNEKAFNDVIHWYNKTQNDYDLKEILCLDQDDYGWIEFISSIPCGKKSDIAKFYERFGVLACLSYILSIHDLHYENLIASGGHPLVADLECFGPNFVAFLDGDDYKHSVLNSGLFMSFIIERNAAIDMSAFAGGGPESEIPFEMSYIKNMGRDDAYFDRKSSKVSLQKNRCMLGKKPVLPYKYKKEVLKGFESAYRHILEHKNVFIELAKRCLKDMRLRIVIRPTAFYSKLISESYHPLLLCRQKTYQKYFDCLVEDKVHFKLPDTMMQWVVESERCQTDNLDIPLFYLKDKTLYDAYGQAMPYQMQYANSEVVLRHLQTVSLTDMKTQMGLMQKNMDLYDLNYLQQEKSSELKKEGYLTDNKKKELINKAQNILDDLLKERSDYKAWKWPENQAILHEKNKKYWILTESDHNLYSGSVGVLLVMAYMSELVGLNQYNENLMQGITCLEHSLDKDVDDIDLSLFSGVGGYLYLAVKCNDLGIDMNHFLEKTLTFIENNLDEWLKKNCFDIITGIAGLLLVLSLLYKKGLHATRVSKIITTCKHYLLEKYPNPYKLPKVAFDTNTKKLVVGFSHGLCGIAYALAKTEEKLSKGSLVYKWITSALNYERKCFSYVYQNWPNTYSEQRGLKGSELYQPNWCHGSLGIGLSRILLNQVGFADKFINFEISTAILSVRAIPLKKSMNICHGHLGRLDFLIFLKKEGLLDDPTLIFEQKQLMASILESNNFCTETDDKIFIPGLMTGRAGLIYQILRVLYPHDVSCILTID